MKRLLLSIAILISCSAHAQQLMSWDEAYSKADEYIARLTIEEKVAMTKGYNKFFFYGVPEKGIPYIYTSDASAGVRINTALPDPSMVEQLKQSTSFPCPLMLAASFNPSLAQQYGRAVGEECRAGGVEVLLGPGVNIYRNSQCGRNFEYYGEDPLLSASMTEQYITGLQSTGTAACIKHFLCNQTEFFRKRSNSIVPERALYEIYMPAFVAGVKSGVAMLMTSYNQLNGEWTGQSSYVIQDLIRGYLGFRGLIMSDWESVYDWRKIIASGQNLEMPGNDNFYFDKTAADLVAEGSVSEKQIEDMIRPTIASCLAFGLYDRQKYDLSYLAQFPQHQAIAYEVASQGTVLLKNNGVLPLSPDSPCKILVTGQFLHEVPHGRGSAAVKGYDNITLSKALRDTYGACVTFSSTPSDEMLRSADVIIASVGTRDAESEERPFELPTAEEEAIKHILKVNSNTIVLVNSGSAIRMTDWADSAAAILYGWYPGQNGFRAIVDIISGKINPSGKLPMTIEREFADSPAYGTVPVGCKLIRNVNEYYFSLYDIHYDESVLVGYRWYETKNIQTLYPFGHGLSYTTFQLAKAKASSKILREGSPVKISVELSNTGSREGAEVVQLYVSENNPTVLRPLKELKSYKKVSLAPKQRQIIEFEISTLDLAFWDDQAHAWTTNPGTYTISIGTSSASISNTLTLTVQ